jgi:hypothetical protein
MINTVRIQMYHSTENGEENYNGHGLTGNSMIVGKAAGRGGRRQEVAGSGGEQWCRGHDYRMR